MAAQTRPPKTVLVIEDHRPNRLVLKGHLEGAGYRVLEATSGRSGLALARAGGVDLITLDMLMEPIDGQTVFRELRADPSTRDIPVVVITIDETMPADLKADGFLAKPFSGQRLLELIERTLDAPERPASPR